MPDGRTLGLFVAPSLCFRPHRTHFCELLARQFAGSATLGPFSPPPIFPIWILPRLRRNIRRCAASVTSKACPDTTQIPSCASNTLSASSRRIRPVPSPTAPLPAPAGGLEGLRAPSQPQQLKGEGPRAALVHPLASLVRRAGRFPRTLCRPLPTLAPRLHRLAVASRPRPASCCSLAMG